MTINARQTGLKTVESGTCPGGSPAVTTKVSLRLPQDMTYDDWERAGRQLSRVVSSTAWWMGDWLIYGRERYADRYERAIQSAGLRYQTLRNYAWVASCYSASRRRPGLSFQHHAELASRPVDDQERWLQRAEQEGWSLRQLRTALRDDRGEPKAVSDPGMRRLVVPDGQFRRWHDAAAEAGTCLEDWVTATLDNAADQLLVARRGLAVVPSTGQPPSAIGTSLASPI